jgi:hypothetical protein
MALNQCFTLKYVVLSRRDVTACIHEPTGSDAVYTALSYLNLLRTELSAEMNRLRDIWKLA